MKKKLLYTLLSIGIIFGGYKVYRYYVKNIYRPDLTMMGFVNMSDGIGRQCVELVQTIKDKYTYNMLHVQQSNYKDVPKDIANKLKQRTYRLGKVLIFEDFPKYNQERFLHLFKKVEPDTVRIAYSMYESNKIPEHWTQTFNRNFDALVVPTHDQVEIYQSSGIDKPVFYIPLGRDLKPFLEKPLKKERHKVFTFGFFGILESRKNVLGLVRSFAKAFGNRQDVRLWIRSRFYSDEKYLAAIYKEVKKHELKNVEIEIEPVSFERYVNNFDKIDCLVNVSQGEGFSNQPREAMAMGIPTLLSNNTAQKEICETGLTGVVETPIEVPDAINVDSCGLHYRFHEEDLAEVLKEMVINYDDFLAQGEAMREWARQFDYESLKIRYSSLIKPKKVVLGDSNQITGEGIVTNSQELYEKYKKVI